LQIRFLKKRFLQNPLSQAIRFSQSAFLNANPLFNVRDNGIPLLTKEQNKPPLNSFQSRLAGWLVGRKRSLWHSLAVTRKRSFVSDGPEASAHNPTVVVGSSKEAKHIHILTATCVSD